MMFLFEAYLMNIKKTDSIYSCCFNAWAFGPVAIPLYEEYKVYTSNDIDLSEAQEDLICEVSEEKKKYLNEIYKFFGKLSSTELVGITHLSDSPWSKIWNKTGGKILYGSQSQIDKVETKEWFKNHFMKTEC
jgi:uncharacterized phage-associated protein